jgi:hypothetical protein
MLRKHEWTNAMLKELIDWENFNEHVKYKSKARIVLVGSGANEQCAGYGSHKTNYRHGRYAFLMNKLDNLVTSLFRIPHV